MLKRNVFYRFLIRGTTEVGLIKFDLFYYKQMTSPRSIHEF
jgi:hypothetical protein